MAAKDICALAKDATKKAESKGTPEAHRDAEEMHRKAAKTAEAEGDNDSVKEHLEQASHHKNAAKKAAKDGDSDSASQEGEPNPLLTWADAKG